MSCVATIFIQALGKGNGVANVEDNDFFNMGVAVAVVAKAQDHKWHLSAKRPNMALNICMVCG